MNGWAPKQVVKEGLVAFGASQASTPISREFGLTSGGASVAFAFIIKASGVSGTCEAMFQTGIDSYWEDVNSIPALADGYNILRFNMPNDATVMPFLAKGRIMLTTAAASGCTIESVQILQEL